MDDALDIQSAHDLQVNLAQNVFANPLSVQAESRSIDRQYLGCSGTRSLKSPVCALAVTRGSQLAIEVLRWYLMDQANGVGAVLGISFGKAIVDALNNCVNPFLSVPITQQYLMLLRLHQVVLGHCQDPPNIQSQQRFDDGSGGGGAVDLELADVVNGGTNQPGDQGDNSGMGITDGGTKEFYTSGGVKRSSLNDRAPYSVSGNIFGGSVTTRQGEQKKKGFRRK